MRKIVVNVEDKAYIKIKAIADIMGISTGALMSQIIMTNDFYKSLDSMYKLMLETINQESSEGGESNA